MRTFKTLSIVTILFLAFSFASNAQGMKYVKIKTTASCEVSKANIEKTLKSEKGVEEASLDMESKVVTVKYSEADTDYDKIVKVITDMAYNADAKSACKDASKSKGTKSECCSKKTSTVGTKSACCDKTKKNS